MGNQLNYTATDTAQPVKQYGKLTLSTRAQESERRGVISAYAAALRLLQLIKSMKLHHKYRLLKVDAEQIRGFKDKVHSWLQSMEKLPTKVYRDLEALAERFNDRAFDLSNIIDYYVVEQKSGGYDHGSDSAFSSLYKDLAAVIKEVDLIIEEMSSAVAECSYFTNTNKDADPHPTTEPKILQRITPVGIEQQLQRIKEELRNGVKERQVVAIVGMGGIGKTALAQRIYEDSIDSKTCRHFDRHFWITLSQEYNVRRILQEILKDQGTEHDSDLGNKLHQELLNRRYLVVLDDLWSIEAWEELEIYLPKDSKGSRIIVTTRNSNIADALSPSFSHKMNLLNPETSWELLSKIVFDGESCPSELQKIGMDIAGNCRGLPLSILTIGGLLSKSEMTLDYWNYVAENVSSLVSLEDDERCSKILSLSYVSMPIHLRLLFLCLAKYSEDERIHVDRLIESWVVRALLKPQPGKRIEEVALDYLMDLVGRNMIFVRSLDEIQEIRELGVHDLLLDLCRRESSNENIYGSNLLYAALSSCAQSSLLEIQYGTFHRFKKRPCLGRIFHQLRDIQTTINLRGGQCDGKVREPQFCTSSPSLSDCKIEYQHYHGLADDIIPETSRNEIRSYCVPMSLIWNLQYCDDESEFFENWQMPQLKICSNGPRGKPGVIFKQLFRTSNLDGRGMKEVTSDAACPFPHLKVLSIRYELDLGHFSLPDSLKVLWLTKILFCERHTKAVMELPNLEKLHLFYCKFENPKWCLEGTFNGLKYLEIFGCSGLEYLQMEEDHFPRLLSLDISNQGTLRISPVICDIPTLLSIKLGNCGDSVVKSAKKILREQRKWGNEVFNVQVQDHGKESYSLKVDDEDDHLSDDEGDDYTGNDEEDMIDNVEHHKTQIDIPSDSNTPGESQIEFSSMENPKTQVWEKSPALAAIYIMQLHESVVSRSK